MCTKLIELRPDRNLLNPNFSGYKLSLEKIPILEQELEISLDRVLPNNEQYSLLHVKLFGLHNHLFNDHYNSNSSVYFIDGSWNVKKVIISEQTGLISEVRKIWQIPHNDERNSGRYNLSLYFPSKDLAVLSDGCGVFYIVQTGDRLEHENWICLYSDEVLDSDKRFTIADAVYKVSENNTKEIHCLLNNIVRNDENEGKFCTTIHWIKLTQTEDNTWGPVSLKVLKGFGQFYYCALERNCQYIYVASDTQFKFTLDSENPISEKDVEDKPTLKVYTWLQTKDDITLRFNTNPHCNKNSIKVIPKPFHITVKYNDIVLLEGQLKNRIDADLTVWNTNSDILEVMLIKTECGLMWSELIVDDDTGEQIIDPSVVTEVHQRLAHLCTETQVIPEETGPTFSSHQIEECDFTGDDTAIFERICGVTHNVTHRINLGSLQFITSLKLSAEAAPALALRHDVDACLWQPKQENGEWKMQHEGTLLAFGYVQASKQQRKFSTCSNSLSYSVVCESTRHIFIYRQSREVMSGELRNRRSGQRVGVVAEQQVVNIGEEEILGIYASENYLYLLTEKTLKVLKVRC